MAHLILWQMSAWIKNIVDMELCKLFKISFFFPTFFQSPGGGREDLSEYSSKFLTFKQQAFIISTPKYILFYFCRVQIFLLQQRFTNVYFGSVRDKCVFVVWNGTRHPKVKPKIKPSLRNVSLAENYWTWHRVLSGQKSWGN